ncbi:hypothetical protein ES703_78277 [subsurface metagenome]
MLNFRNKEMNEILALIDKKIDQLKNNSKNNHYLELTDEEYKILKNFLIPKELHKYSEITNYRGISIKVINKGNNEQI